MPAGLIDIPIVHTLYESYALWHELNLKFPKSQRYTLGQTCATNLLIIIEFVLSAASVTNASDKLASLLLASAKLDTLKLLIRLAKDCECVTNVQYLDMQSRLHETGKMLGGWMKSLG